MPSDYAEDSWSASVGRENGNPALYSDHWTEKQHYVCRYDCE